MTGSQPRARASASRKPTQQPRSTSAPFSHVALEPLEQGARRRALAGLLLDVVVGRRLAVGLLELGLGRDLARAACGRSRRSGRCPTARCRTGPWSGSGPPAPARRRPPGARRGGLLRRLTQRALTRREASLSAVSLAARELSLLSVVAPVFNEEGQRAARSASGRSRPSATMPFEIVIVDDGSQRRDARDPRGARRGRPAHPGGHAVAQLRPPDRAHRRPRARRGRRGRDDRRRPPGPARADPRARRVVAQGLGRRLRGARGSARARRASS